jgi:hypothetical protein
MEISGGFYYLNYNVAPYNMDQIGWQHPLTKITGKTADDKIIIFGSVHEDLNCSKQTKPGYLESFRGGIVAKPLKNVFVYTNFFLDEALAINPEYQGKKWRGLAGEVENAFVAYDHKKIGILFGRFGAFWGPSDNSLVLSSDARPMDAFSIRLNWGRLNFTYQLAQLDRLADTLSDTNVIFYNRFLAGHRIDFRLLENLNIGLFETIIFSGENRGLDFAYLNPLLFFHSRQLNENRDENIFLGFDISWYLWNRHRLYGQLLVDDFQIEKREAGDEEPSEIGYLIGWDGIDLLNFFDIKVEYLKITNRTYNQVIEANRYINRGRLIGNNLGPDGEKLGLSLIKWFGYRRKISLDIVYQRKGEGSVYDIWDTPWLDINGDYSEPFPTGIVENMLALSLTHSGFFKDFLFYSINTGIEDFKNAENIEGNNLANPFLTLRLSLFYSVTTDIE